MNTMFEDALVTKVIMEPAADNETLTPAAPLDMSGFEGVMFVAVVEGGEAITCSLKAQQGAASDGGDAADLAGTAVDVSPTADPLDGYGVLEITRPQKRYVQPAVVCGNFTTPRAVCVIAIQYGAREVPQSNTGEQHDSPSEGTA